MAAAIKGYRMVLIMPAHMSLERRAGMKAYGAELILTPKEGGMEASIALARKMATAGEGRVLNQFGNFDNPRAHYEGFGSEILNNIGVNVSLFGSERVTT